MNKSADELMSELVAMGVTISTTNSQHPLTAVIRDAAKRAGNYWCSKCEAAADHDDEEHEPSDAGGERG